MMPRTNRLAIVLLGCGAFACLGQDPQMETRPAAVQVKVVKGLAFSATVVTESTQVLADGNRILRRSEASISRDSDGRTRREVLLPETGVASDSSIAVVFIHDPAAGVAYVLEPRSKLARRNAASTASVDKQSAPLKVEAVEVTSNSIGPQFIEGFQANGTRVSRALAPGQAGNERALELVSETWYSTELQAILMNRTTDPRLGEVVYRLTDIRVGEPPPSLFEIPADYTIREEQPGSSVRQR